MGEVKNWSKITKDVLVAVTTYVAPRLVDPDLNKELVQALSLTPPDPVGADESYHSVDNGDNGDRSAPEPKTRICRSSWRGIYCRTPGCSFRHPIICSSAGCMPTRLATCMDFHPRVKTTKTRSGNGRRGGRQPEDKAKEGKKSRNARKDDRRRSVISYRDLHRQKLELELRLARMEAPKVKGRTLSYAQAASACRPTRQVLGQDPTLANYNIRSDVNGYVHGPVGRDLASTIAAALAQALREALPLSQ